MPSSRPRTNLRKLLSSRLLALVGGSVLLSAAGMWWIGIAPALNRSAQAEFNRAAQDVMHQLDGTFSPAVRLLGAGTSWLQGKAPDITRPEEFNRFFKPWLEATPQATSVVGGTSDGQGWLLLQYGDGHWRNRLTDVARHGRLHRFIDQLPNGETIDRWSEQDYDARQRPWFKGAVQTLPTGADYWTPPYTFFTTGDPGITVSRKIGLDNGGYFVLGVDLMLRDLSATTMGARIGKEGLALVLTQDKKLLALPRAPKDMPSQQWNGNLLKPSSALALPVVDQALEAWREAGEGALPVARFTVDGRRWLVGVNPYKLGQQSLWVFTIAPAADFAPDWGDIAVGLAALLALLVAAATAMSKLQTRAIARPLEELLRQSQRIGELDFSNSVTAKTSIQEIAQLADAHSKMREILQRNQESLELQSDRLQAQVQELQKAQEQIHHLAFFDPLTHLPNRRLLSDRLEHALLQHARSGHYGALLFMDLDNFKTLNDTLGHGVGDVWLREVAKRLSRCVREGDTVARLGGDEFVVVLEALGPDESAARQSSERVAIKMLDALRQPYDLGKHHPTFTASIGITLFGASGVTSDQLFKQADMAMYHAKASGRDRFSFFGPDMQARLATRTELESELRDGLEQDELFLTYQPQVDRKGRLKGAEVLLRWQSPKRGLVMPGEFIAVAEESGLILPLGHWVLRQTCLTLARWKSDTFLGSLELAVNVSARQFRECNFADTVRDILSETGAPPARLRLELTESALLDEVETVISHIHELRAMGVGFSLDDFGTGYSSLTYLKRLPLTQLKIDRSFVRDLLDDDNDAVIARTLIALGHSLGLQVVAEGVETQAQLDFLMAAGCDGYQGYLFGKPGVEADLKARQQTEADTPEWVDWQSP